MKVACKCHGVSGSCSVRTCWSQLPSFREIGDRLKMRYDGASEVKFNRLGTRLRRRNKELVKPTREDLIYVDQSPDYCRFDPKTGSHGTTGRYCDKDSQGLNGCSLMCCGRGYNTYRRKITSRCNCKFQWCCDVICQTCERIIDVHTCK